MEISLEDYIEKSLEIFRFELEIHAISNLLNISIYILEIVEKLNGYRFLYKIDNDNELICYSMILNHVYLEPNNINSQYYKLWLISNIVFNIKKLNENNSIKDNVNNVNLN